MRSSQSFVRVAFHAILGLTVAAALLPSSLVAQQPTDAEEPARPDSQFSSFEKSMTAAERSKMFDLLARDVAELEKKGNILKRVVRLTRDTVVHIEAKKTDSTSLNYGRRRSVEEAGSGVIVRQRLRVNQPARHSRRQGQRDQGPTRRRARDPPQADLE